MPTWYADIDIAFPEPLTDELVDVLIDELEPFSGALAVPQDSSEGGVSLALDAKGHNEAYRGAAAFLAVLESHIPGSRVDAIRVLTEETRERENRAPVFPEVVSIPEIGEILGVGRARARQIADRATFPRPLLAPRTGRLWSRAAVEAWAETPRPAGRPRAI